MSRVSVGFLVLKDGVPFRPATSGYAWQRGYTSPPRIYSAEYRAKTQANKVLGSVVEVFYEREDNES